MILVETKWSAGSWAMTDRDHIFQAALGQTARNARQLTAWHDIARHERPKVKPVLVLWGQARSRFVDQPPARHDSSGVVVMAGDQVKAWALRQGRGALTPEQVDAIWADLAKHAGRRDELERRTRPMPGSLIELVGAELGCLVSALVGFLVAGQALGLLDDLLLWIPFGLAALAGLEWLRRRPHWPWQLRALQLGIASAYVLAAVAVAKAYLTR